MPCELPISKKPPNDGKKHYTPLLIVILVVPSTMLRHQALYFNKALQHPLVVLLSSPKRRFVQTLLAGALTTAKARYDDVLKIFY